MKILSLAIALTVVLSSSTLALAADNTGNQQPKAKPAKVHKAKKAKTKADTKLENEALTGSYLKREVKRNGFVTDGPNAVFVIDSETIRNSGASDVRDLLIRKGFNR